jgi:GNAT superfamily N-acetyltransferase
MSGAAITTRPATIADAQALDRIALAAEDHGDFPSYAPGINVPYLRYLIGRGRAIVAEADGEPVGFGASVWTGRSTHLADLFVLPARQSHGIGRRLLDEVLGDAWPRTTFGSGDPRALPLYLRAGMRALWPNLYLTGDPTSSTGRPFPRSGRSSSSASRTARPWAWGSVARGSPVPVAGSPGRSRLRTPMAARS